MSRTMTLIINHKAFRQAFANGLEIAIASRTTAHETGVDILNAPPDTRLMATSKITRTIAQHMDPIESGAGTGKMSALEVKESGAIGSMLNHSEKPMRRKDIATAILLLRENRLIPFVFVPTVFSLEKLLRKEHLEFAIYEPPPLIGGELSVTSAKREEVRKFVAVSNDNGVTPMIGAGIRNGRAAEESVEQGARGVAVGHGIMQSANCTQSIREITLALSKGL